MPEWREKRTCGKMLKHPVDGICGRGSMNKILIMMSVATVFVCCQLLRCVQGPQVKGPVVTTSENTVELDRSGFDSLVIEQPGKAVVEFYSPICQSCAAMLPVYDSIGICFGDSLLVARMDADAQLELYKQYADTDVPSFVFFDNGTKIRTESMIANDTTFEALSRRIQSLLDGTLTSVEGETGEKKDPVAANYLTLDSLSFDSTVLSSGTVAMVFFMVPTGPPCIHMDSVVNYIAPRFEERAIIAKVIVVWGLELLSQRYDIYSVPRFLFFKDGVQVEEEPWLGTFEGDTLAAVLERLLEK